MNGIEPIRESYHRRGITRLCHVTQARNLPHILTEGRLLSTRDLANNDLPLHPNDKQRLDGHDDYISCTIEYPNIWFLNQVANRERLFRDWIVLEITPDYLWQHGTLFSPVNAAKGGGRYIEQGAAAFEALFDPAPAGSRFTRSMFHLDACPTDNQAEVLVASPIPVASIVGIVFPSQEAAQTERERLELLRLANVSARWKASPEMFDARLLAGRIQSGERVAEELVDPSNASSRQSN